MAFQISFPYIFCRIENGRFMIIFLKPVQHNLQLLPHRLRVRRITFFISIILYINCRGKHSKPVSNRMNKMVRLGITAAVKAEKMVGSCRQVGLTGLFPVICKPGICMAAPLCSFYVCKHYILLCQYRPVYFSLIVGQINAGHRILFF